MSQVHARARTTPLIRAEIRQSKLGVVELAEHRLSPPRHPQTNGLVERFNGRISEVVQQTRFKSGAELEATLLAYCKTYNHHIPQRSLDHRSPVQALQTWQVSKPDLFKRAVHKQPGLDN